MNKYESIEKEIEKYKLDELDKIAAELKYVGLDYSSYFGCYADDILWMFKNRQKIIRNKKLIELIG